MMRRIMRFELEMMHSIFWYTILFLRINVTAWINQRTNCHFPEHTLYILTQNEIIWIYSCCSWFEVTRNYQQFEVRSILIKETERDIDVQFLCLWIHIFRTVLILFIPRLPPASVYSIPFSIHLMGLWSKRIVV